METKIEFKIVTPHDKQTFEIIANWYVNHWKIPIERTLTRLDEITTDSLQFQVLMLVDNIPVATGGVYSWVGILDKVAHLNEYKHWLALIYTDDAYRQKGYGALLCKFIQNHAKTLGLKKLHLYTDTAERLYARLGWQVLERLSVAERNVVVMDFDL